VKADQERGVALITVLVVLAAMALLMTGVYTLVSDSTRSASQNTRYQEAKAAGVAAMGQVASLIDRVAVPNFKPAAPQGYGVQWTSLANFGAYIRDEVARGATSAPNPCTQTSPDISYQVQTNQGQASVAACVKKMAAGGIAGSGSNVVFARTNRGTSNNESLFEVTVWVTGPNGETRAQREATIRGFY